MDYLAKKTPASIGDYKNSRRRKTSPQDKWNKIVKNTEKQTQYDEEEKPRADLLIGLHKAIG